MRSLQWSPSDAVWVTEIDDEHKEIFEMVARLQKSLSSAGPPAERRKLLEDLVTSVADHFAHEERLMRAARYGSLRWHKQQHDAARKKVQQFALRIKRHDSTAGTALVEYLQSWLHNHTRVADRMLGSFLRNHLRAVAKLTFRAGTQPVNARAWVDAKGDTFDPLATRIGF
jgi:hemerythrin